MASTDALPVPRKGVAFRVTFPILKNDGTLIAAAAGLDSEVSKDAGTFADCTNEATEIATSSGVYYLDLTATEMNADTVAIVVKSTTTDAIPTVLTLYPQEAGDIQVNATYLNGSATAASKLASSAAGIVTGTVDTAAFTATTTEFEADDITEATADHYNGRVVVFTSGNVAGQASDITDYALSGSNGHFTVTALTEAPDNNATFVIV